MGESVVFTFPYQVNGNHATELSAVGHVISELEWKSTFDFTEIVNNCRLKRGTVCKIVRFVSQFSLKLYTQFWKYFHSKVLGSVGREKMEKIGCWNLITCFNQKFWKDEMMLVKGTLMQIWKSANIFVSIWK